MLLQTDNAATFEYFIRCFRTGGNCVVLQKAPFELLESIELKILSRKTALLIMLTSIMRVKDLQAFSFENMCFEFESANSHMILRPWPEYVPKVPTTHFQDPVGNLLCPIHTLQIVEHTRRFTILARIFRAMGWVRPNIFARFYSFWVEPVSSSVLGMNR